MLTRHVFTLAFAIVGLAGAATAQSEADLLAAARGEPPITVYDSTGKVVETAENFSKKYDLQATGLKVKATEQFEKAIRESQAGNVQGDVLLITDAAAALAQLLPQGIVMSWLPPDMASVIPAEYQDPLTITTNANVWAYNSEVYKTCPVSNIWQLTEPEWKGRVAIIDPLNKGTITDWFNQMATHGSDAVAAAYQAQYGKPLETQEASAAAAWIAALAANGPLLTKGDEDIADAVGAPGQKTPLFGLMSSAKFRDNADKGYKLAICDGLKPWAGWRYSKLALIASGTRSPNAAKLFVRYMLTEEGIAPQMEDGKVPTNTTISMPDSEPSGLMAVADQLEPYDSSSGLDDFDTRQDWQDFWRLNYRR